MTTPLAFNLPLSCVIVFASSQALQTFFKSDVTLHASFSFLFHIFAVLGGSTLKVCHVSHSLGLWFSFHPPPQVYISNGIWLSYPKDAFQAVVHKDLN